MARILICDDEEMIRDSLAGILSREKHEIVACGDGQAALQRLNDGGKFDLLITDLRMPKVSGLELLAEARKLRPEMPVVLMTAFATVQTAVEAMKMGPTTTSRSRSTATTSSIWSTARWSTTA